MIHSCWPSSGMMLGFVLAIQLCFSLNILNDCSCRQAMHAEAVQIVIRYNQRGVSTSSGSKSIWGASDLTDAVSVCQQVLSLHDGPQHLHLIG